MPGPYATHSTVRTKFIKKIELLRAPHTVPRMQVASCGFSGFFKVKEYTLRVQAIKGRHQFFLTFDKDKLEQWKHHKRALRPTVQID